MALEIPFDLIKKVQILLRKEANLASYDPDDPSIPNLPSLEDTISELDPSPPYLRCRHCRGRLLRGLQSMICVFCGKQQSKEAAPEPINFRSTSGYRWLLESLDLDGSEMVGPSFESSESNRGQSTPKDEVSLYDLLDLEIQWIAESEKIGTDVTNEVPVQSKSPLNLAGVDLDHFFSEASRDTASDKNLASNVQIDDTEHNSFQGHKNLSLFENVQPSEAAVRSTKDNNDSFSGWEVVFQSTGSGTLHEESKSFDPFVGSMTDLSAPVETIFGSGKDLTDGKLKDDTIPSASNTNWFQDDLWSNSLSGVADRAEQFEMTVSVENANNSSSTRVDWIQDDQWQTGNNKTPDTKTIDEDNDTWNDFTDSTSAHDTPNKSWIQKPSVEQTSEINLFSSSNDSQDMDFGSISHPDFFPGVVSSRNGSAEGNFQPEVSVSDRMADPNADVGDVSEAITRSRDNDVEMLISQMHDLSFMLESNLSIPPKC